MLESARFYWTRCDMRRSGEDALKSDGLKTIEKAKAGKEGSRLFEMQNVRIQFRGKGGQPPLYAPRCPAG